MRNLLLLLLLLALASCSAQRIRGPLDDWGGPLSQSWPGDDGG